MNDNILDTKGIIKQFYDFRIVLKIYKELSLEEDLNYITNFLFWMRLDELIEVEEIDFYYRCIEKGLRNDFGNYCKEWVSLPRMEQGYEWRLL